MRKSEMLRGDSDKEFRVMEVVDKRGSDNPLDWKYGLVERKISELSKFPGSEKCMFYVCYETDSMIGANLINATLMIGDEAETITAKEFEDKYIFKPCTEAKPI